ncbi:MAG: ankyrin repeat domain-containing protein [Candidatus Babeliales bacterium]
MKLKVLLWVTLCKACSMLPMDSSSDRVASKPLTFLERGLIEAAKEGNTLRAKVCLLLKANPDARDEFKATAFHYATGRQNFDLLTHLLHYGAQVDAATANDLTALHITALLHNTSSVATFLLDHGAFIDALDDEGCTALHRALAFHHKPVARLLIDRGSNVGIQNQRGQLPEHINASCMFDICYAPFASALCSGEVQEIERFLKQGVNLFFKTQGGTPMHWAIISEKFEVVMPQLLKHVAWRSERSLAEKTLTECLNVQDLANTTPLHWVGQIPCFARWQQLMLYGAKLTILDDQDATPLSILNTALRNWEVNEILREKFFEFLACPMGTIKECGGITCKDVSCRVFAFLCGLYQLRKDHNIAIPHNVVHALLAKYIAHDMSALPLGTYQKTRSTAEMITQLSFKQLAQLLQYEGEILQQKIVEALIGRHTKMLREVCALETNEGNTIFGMKLDRALSCDAYQRLRDAKYLKLLECVKEQ